MEERARECGADWCDVERRRGCVSRQLQAWPRLYLLVSVRETPTRAGAADAPPRPGPGPAAGVASLMFKLLRSPLRGGVWTLRRTVKASSVRSLLLPVG